MTERVYLALTRRRDFMVSLVAGTLLSRVVRADELPSDLEVTRLIGFDLPTRRSKIAGKNARLDVHGDTATDRMVRIETNMKLVGVGNCGANEQETAPLLGRNPFDFYREAETRMESPLGAGTMPLWDLLGKVRNKPIHGLLGTRGPERVPCYDGSIYFADLLPQYANRWEDRFREEIDMGLALGHRAFKVKIGRGAKWMPREEGDARDIAVLEVIRDHAGPDVLIGVDANNGYDLMGALRCFEKVGKLNIAFAEEMFEEQVDQCLEFKEFLRGSGLKTLVADGETQDELDVFKPFIGAKAVDIYQADMNRFGYEGILLEASWCEPKGLRVAPHNWGSLVGYYMQIHVGRAIPNFYRAEHDPLSSEVLIADGYSIDAGQAHVPDAPGAGLVIDEKKFAEEAKIRFDLRA
ncbi:MAG: enolase C-terminal domain-like protein [Vicinamibacteraceae bacterium]